MYTNTLKKIKSALREIILPSSEEMLGFDEMVKEYKYSSGAVIRVFVQENETRKLFEYDNTERKELNSHNIPNNIIWTFDGHIFDVARKNEHIKTASINTN